jgi:hypothetical protein
MSDIKLTHGEIEATEKKAPEFGWRQATLGVGVFLLVVSLFMSAGAKGSLGRLPAYVACLGIVLLAVPMVAGVMDRLSSKKGNRKAPSTGSRS